MENDIKDLLDNIIDDTKSSYPDATLDTHDSDVKFDKNEFREKLSLRVLHDIISSMMRNDTTDVDKMIDHSIMRHIRDNYNGSCYGYLTKSCDELNSPLLGNIILEIDDKVERIAQEVCETKDISRADVNKIDIKEMMKDVDNYDEFCKKLEDKVSNQVVEDVAAAVTDGAGAVSFDNLDEEMERKNIKSPDTDVTEESVILKMTASIVMEAKLEHVEMSTREGIDRAIVEYCIGELDHLFKRTPKISVYDRYCR